MGRQPGARARLSSMISRGETPLGAFITSSDPSTSMILGDLGFDFLVIDDEHGVLGPRDVLNHVRSARATGTLALQRISANETWFIQRALDGGADGIIVPKIGTAAQIERAVRAARYQSGGRGVCPVIPATNWSQDGWSEFTESSNADVVVIPLIETDEGVRNFAEIAAVDGVDFAFFGFADLSADLGLEYGANDELQSRWNQLTAQAAAAGVHLGTPLGAGFDGAAWGSITGDLNLLRTSARDRLRGARALYAPADSGGLE
jgi:4-hydroxy-2-oxoheptanedioate aldolase